MIISTASIAAFEGQIGQVAYTAARRHRRHGPHDARDLGGLGIRALAIAPSLFATGITEGIPTTSRSRSRRTPSSRSAWAGPRRVRAARHLDRREPDAQRLVHPPRRRAALRTQVYNTAPCYWERSVNGAVSPAWCRMQSPRVGPGRPAVGARVPVRLPPDLLDDIDRRARTLAGRERRSSVAAREAIGTGAPEDDGVDRAQIRRMLAIVPAPIGAAHGRRGGATAQHSRKGGPSRR